MKAIVIGTRGSKLALWQARWIAAKLAEAGHPTRIEIIKTTGDRITDVALAKLGAEAGLKGVFTKEIEDALLDGAIDLAVHSLKDLPTALDPRLALGCTPPRADPRDALVGKKLVELQPGERVGTSSLRRTVQFHRLRPDVAIENIRGNIDTRLRKLDEGRYDAILLAAAGLKRLGLGERIAETLDPDQMAPAVGQGALGVEIRADDRPLREALAPLDDPATRAAVVAERALLDHLGGGCQVPLGGYARIEGSGLRLRAAVASPSGDVLLRVDESGDRDRPEELGARAARRLLANGAAELIAAAG